MHVVIVPDDSSLSYAGKWSVDCFGLFGVKVTNCPKFCLFGPAPTQTLHPAAPLICATGQRRVRSIVERAGH
jgi:hypothetical protein